MKGTQAREVLFRDDFSSGLTNWTPNWLGAPGQVTKRVNGAEASCYDPACVTIAPAGPRGANAAVLKAEPLASPVTIGGVQYHYRSGMMTTHGKFSFVAPARVEAKLLLPGDVADGEVDDWPSFWTNGEDWPATGEVDVMEGLHGHPAFHVHDTAVPGGVGGNGALAARPKAPAGTLGWHRFAADRYVDHVDFEYDGVKVGTVSEGVAAFADKPHYLIVQLALSASISPPVKAPAELVCAWVEVTRLRG